MAADKTAAVRGAPAGGSRERRPAVWPWLIMPLIVLLVFYALFRVHHRNDQAPPVKPPPPPASSAGTVTAQPS
jgi:hypothetical protein